MPQQSFSFYVGKKTYPFLLDLLAEKRGFRSRSDLLNQILTHLFIRDGFLHPKTLEPTDIAIKKSRPLRKFLLAEAHTLASVKTAKDPKAKKKQELLTNAENAVKTKKRVPMNKDSGP